MNVSIINEFRIEAVLSCDELFEFGITYDEIDYGNIETRRVVWSVFDKIKKQTGRDISLSGKVLIEVLKDCDSSFRFCYSFLPPRDEDAKSVKILTKSETLPETAEFQNFEDVLNAVYNLSKPYNSALYEKNGIFKLVFYVPKEEKNILFDEICEFCELCRSGALENARLTENWNCILPQNAVNILSCAFSKNI